MFLYISIGNATVAVMFIALLLVGQPALLALAQAYIAGNVVVLVAVGLDCVLRIDRRLPYKHIPKKEAFPV